MNNGNNQPQKPGEIGPIIGEERSKAATALRKDAAERQQDAFITDHPITVMRTSPAIP